MGKEIGSFRREIKKKVQEPNGNSKSENYNTWNKQHWIRWADYQIGHNNEKGLVNFKICQYKPSRLKQGEKNNGLQRASKPVSGPIYKLKESQENGAEKYM